MDSNEKLMRENGEEVKSVSEINEAFAHVKQRLLAQGKPIESLEELENLTRNARPTDEFVQQVLNVMRTRVTNIILMFGPGHGQTMQLSGPPAAEILWQGDRPVHLAHVPESFTLSREGIHRYRLDDDYESSNMEECTLYVHHERCCEQRMPEHRHQMRGGSSPYTTYDDAYDLGNPRRQPGSWQPVNYVD